MPVPNYPSSPLFSRLGRVQLRATIAPLNSFRQSLLTELHPYYASLHLASLEPQFRDARDNRCCPTQHFRVSSERRRQSLTALASAWAPSSLRQSMLCQYKGAFVDFGDKGVGSRGLLRLKDR